MTKSRKSFFRGMFDFLKKKHDRLDCGILKGFIGGQVKIFFPTTKDCLLGDIKDIIPESGCLEISCTWIAHKHRKGRVWYFDKKRTDIGSLSIRLKPGWEKNWDSINSDGIMISGQEGNMILKPKGSEFIHVSEIRNYIPH